MGSFRARREVLALVLVSLLFLSGCLVRKRVVAPAGAQRPSQPLLTATRDDLIAKIRTTFDPIQSFSMKVDMSPSIGALYGGQVSDYPTISGIVLFSRPDDIRVIGLDPVIHSTAFDMVSMGNDFKVSIPIKSSFVMGHNDTPPNSKNKLENLRPEAFLTALIVRPPDPVADIPILVDDTNETKAVYILMLIRRNGDQYRAVRFVYFDRYTLQIARQKTFDAIGNITADIRYRSWNSHGAIMFPNNIDIQRPQDGYEVQLTVTDIKFNTGDVTAEKFVLNQPPGSKVRVLN
jgi:outer membrane lipoprotein-sorting protein